MKQTSIKGAVIGLLTAGNAASASLGQAVAQTAGQDFPGNRKKSRTFTFQGASAAYIVGYRWGAGVLTLENGSDTPSMHAASRLEKRAFVKAKLQEQYTVWKTSIISLIVTKARLAG